MTETLRWLAITEILCMAGIPLTFWLLRSLPDRGYTFAKLVALLLLTWVLWLLGSMTHVGNNIPLLWVLLLSGGLTSWICLGRKTLPMLRQSWKVIAAEEVLFIVAFCIWVLIRSFHPDIAATEKPMDLMLLQTSSRSASFPPQDLWLAGHGVNYYYFGYLLMAVTAHLAAVSPLVSFNLALAFIFALAVSGSYGLTYALTNHGAWAGLGPLFIVLLGNLHSFFFQVIQGRFPWNQSYWFWESSRVITSTINEFPMFSFILGDLHPHLLALPIALLSMGIAMALFRETAAATSLGAIKKLVPRITMAAVLIGALFATNSWDYPTYLLVALAATWLAAHGLKDASLRVTLPAITTVLMIGVSILAYLPFYLGYASPTHGIGHVTTATNPGQFAQVFGFFGLLIVALIGVLAWEAGLLRSARTTLRQPSPEVGSLKLARRSLSETILGFGLVILVAILTLLHLWVLLVGMSVVATALALIRRRELEDASRFALVLVLVAAFLVCVTETVYIRDSFDGSIFYRMNTVFKLYFQLWIILGLAATYGVYHVTRLLQHRGGIHALAPWLLVVALGTGMGLIYSLLGSVSYYASLSGGNPTVHAQPLNGMETLQTSDTADYRAIRWLQGHISGNPIILEATGGEYSNFARVSIFTGLPTLLGWQGHEQQWRGNIPLLQSRHALVDRIYSTGSVSLAQGLLRSNHVSLVYVGPCERQVYGSATGAYSCGTAAAVPSAPGALSKFVRFMRVIYQRDGVVIYRMT